MDEPALYLGISPGTHKLGIIVFCGTECMEWLIKNFKGQWSEEKLLTIVRTFERLLAKYEPKGVAIKVTAPGKTNRTTQELIPELLRLAKSYGSLVRSYDLKSLEGAWHVEGKLNKQNMIQALTNLYPDFSPVSCKAMRWPGNAHEKIFEAAAAALLLIHETVALEKSI